MIPPSTRLAKIAPSATVAMTQRARALARDGRDIISLSAGEPDFFTPDFVKGAAIAAINNDQTKYTNIDGIAALKEAICEKFLRDNGLRYLPEQISVAPGGKAIIFNALIASLNPGDEVIIPAPYWVSYPDIVRFAGATPVIVPTCEDDNFLLQPNALEKSITPNTRWLILNSPNNPTGSVYSRAALAALADILVEHPGIAVLCDDIYEHIVYDDTQSCTLAEVAPTLFERILTMNGASKAYSMTGWRIGYAGGPASLISSMAKIMSQSTGNPCTISQWATIAALRGDQGFLESRRNSFQERRDFVVRRINQINGLTCKTPKGAFYVYVSCKQHMGKTTASGVTITSDENFVEALLEDQGVAVVHGGAFGLTPYFRISYAACLETLERACKRIEKFCNAIA